MIEPFLGQGNSFHGAGGRNSKRAQLRYSLRLIRSLVETNDERIILDFVCHGLIQLLTPIIYSISSKMRSDQPHNELLKLNNQMVTRQYRIQEDTTEILNSGCYQNEQKNVINIQENMEEDMIGLEMQCDVLLILSKLCGNVPERKQMIGTDGINSIIKLLKQLSNRFATIESVQYRLLTQPNNKLSYLPSTELVMLHREPLIKLAHALIEAIWCCIIGSNNCEDYFLMKNGATYLLNLLEWYPLESVNYLLGCLVDLTENYKCLSYLSCWSGIRPLNETEDHIDIYNQRRHSMNDLELTTSLLTKSPDLVVSTKLHKILTNTNKIITSYNNNNNNNSINNENKETVLINKTEDNLIPYDIDIEQDSIHVWLNGPSLAQLLCYIWRWEEKRMKVSDEISRNQYGEENGNGNGPSTYYSPNKQCDSLRMNIYALFLRLGFNNQENLSPKDQITLKKIESYFDLKIGEIWRNIEKEFTSRQFRPITPDKQMISSVLIWYKKQMDKLYNEEKEILNTSKMVILSEEQNYYSFIRKVIRNHDFAMNNYHDYLLRTSNYEYLKEAHLKQLSAINASRIEPLNKMKESKNRILTKTPLELDETIENGNNNVDGVPSNNSIQATESSVYHKTDIDKLNITAFCSKSITIDSTPKHLFMHPTKLEKELLDIVEVKQPTVEIDKD
ncbi:unnamed protein product [Heterobilharzia americana]|nr:unnamed protein product [Heterobilharzia americana]